MKMLMPLSFIVHKSNSYARGRTLVKRLKDGNTKTIIYYSNSSNDWWEQ